MQKYILIVAGGSGSRFGTEIPKQFAELNGLPLLMHTFYAFSVLSNASYVLVLPQKYVGNWKQLCLNYNFTIEHQIAEGGPKRFHSVKSGLKFVPDGCLVAIHDGVRPLVSTRVINDCFTMAERKGSAVPAIPVTESIREVDGLLNKPVNREKLVRIQTPQVFHSSKIKKAYQQAFHEKFTDDATVFEKDGNQIFVTEGNSENIKITNPADFIYAEALLKNEFHNLDGWL